MITIKEIEKIAKLVRLSFTENELSDFQVQLTNIMNMIDDLNEVDCSNVEPLTSVCSIKQRMRKDIPQTQDISEELFSNVSGSAAEFAKEIQCFIVPKVVE
jgi:aspartyl-tRNA(Asn)/glutamyl-tRNA(Gln) amidotransferase subunit C